MRIQRLIPTVVVGVLVLLAFSAVPAFAREIHAYSGASFGKEGSGPGEFKEPAGVAVSEVGAEKGDVYVVDKGNNRVEVFSSTGVYISQFNGSAAKTGAFLGPQSIAVDNSGGPSSGDVYVTDTGNKVIDKFTATGAYIGQITEAEGAKFAEAVFGVAVDPAGTLWIYYEHEERGFIANYSNAVSNVFVATRKSLAVSGFAAPGLGFAVNSEDDLYLGTAFEEIAEVNTGGQFIRELEERQASAVAVDAATGDAYIDNLTSVAAFTSGGALTERFGAEGGVEHLTAGTGIAIGSALPKKPVYVADSSADAVRVFTDVVVPDVTTEAASKIEAEGATLHGTVNPDGTSVTECEFEYGTEEGNYTQTAPCVPAVSAGTPLTGSTPIAVTAEITGLSPTTTYHYRLAAVNTNGRNSGADVSFATPAAPAISSEEVTAVNSSEPKLTARINPNYQETSYSFEYSPNATGSTLEAPIKVVPGAPPATLLPAVFEELTTVPVAISGLQAGTIYHYRAVAKNATGTTEGPLEEFTADGGPAITLAPAINQTRSTATILGTITPGGLPTTYHIDYVPQSAYEAAVADHATNPYAAGRSTHESLSIGEGYAPVPVQITLEELDPQTIYHYAIIASNEVTSTTSSDGTVATSAATSPVATTGPAENITQLSATITGSIQTQGLATTEQFEFGTTPYGGGMSPVTVVASAGGLDSIAHAFSNDLQPGTTYYYRVLASNQDGEVDGAEQSFTTPGFPAALAPATVLPFVPYTSLAVLQAREAKEGKASAPKALTRGEKLTKALRVCRGERGSRRVGCERKARRRFGPVGRKRAKR